MEYPKKIEFGDITIRDGFQHEEKFISTEAKVYYAEELILAGVKNIEVSNFGNPINMPQFQDADEVFKRIRSSKKLERAQVNWDEITLTAVTIRERAVDRAIQAKLEGYGPDRILMMVSTDEEHHYANSGTTLPEYWREAERSIQKARDAGMKACGTVSTIWGSPISGPTEMKEAIQFTRHWLSIGATDIEHADHDGSASPDQVYKYYSMLMDALPDDTHIAHFHDLRGWGIANALAALQAGITFFEGTLGGLGGQPANFFGDTPVGGTGAYYYKAAGDVGLICTEDFLSMVDEMGIETGIDIDKIVQLGTFVERTVGRKLRSDTVRNGRVVKEANEDFKRAGLRERKASRNEKVDQKYPVR